MDGRPNRVLVVDDHPMLRVGVVAFLSEAPDCDIVGETDNADDALELARMMRPDIVLLDIRLRGERNGVDLARDLREQVPEAKIVVLTNFPHEPYVRAMMELGVDGYLLKDTPPSDVLEGLRMVMRGSSVFSSTVSSNIVQGYLHSPYNRARRNQDSLTSREAEVLQLVANGQTNDDIADALGVTVKAIQVHLTNLYAKLNAKNRTEAVVKAARRGLVILDDSQ
jgi:DNA-binding NarL/FixJ family response regulator